MKLFKSSCLLLALLVTVLGENHQEVKEKLLDVLQKMVLELDDGVEKKALLSDDNGEEKRTLLADVNGEKRAVYQGDDEEDLKDMEEIYGGFGPTNESSATTNTSTTTNTTTNTTTTIEEEVYRGFRPTNESSATTNTSTTTNTTTTTEEEVYDGFEPTNENPATTNASTTTNTTTNTTIATKPSPATISTTSTPPPPPKICLCSSACLKYYGSWELKKMTKPFYYGYQHDGKYHGFCWVLNYFLPNCCHIGTVSR